MKICPICGKETSRNNIYCSIQCASIARKNKTLQDWKDGVDSGIRKNGALSQTIRNYLLEKAGYACEKCGWHEVNPFSNLIPLEIHHIDGNALNCKENNLQVLCPNCHSLTSNFRGLNKDSVRERTATRKNYCVDCGKEIGQDAIRCRSCAGKQKITQKPVSREELKEMIRTIPFTKIGEKFNVTDNTIRKWCIRYNLPSKKKDINKYNEEEWGLL